MSGEEKMNVDHKNLEITFQCSDRFNDKHEHKRLVTNENGNKLSYKDLIQSVGIFQTEVNTLMTRLVEREKAELKDKPIVHKKKKIDDLDNDSDEVKNKEDETDTDDDEEDDGDDDDDDDDDDEDNGGDSNNNAGNGSSKNENETGSDESEVKKRKQVK